MDPQLKEFFGRQLPLFPEVEPPVTVEEDEAFKDLEHKQVGGNHYLKAGSNMQPWDIAMAWKLNGWEMNVLKYTLRHRYKNRREDIEKAIHCLEFILANYDELYGEL